MTCSRINDLSMWDCLVLGGDRFELSPGTKLTWMENSDSLGSICRYYGLLTIFTHNIYDRRIKNEIWGA
jgi:hypothetical protein